MPKGGRLHGNERRGGTGHAEGRRGKGAELGEREGGREAGERGGEGPGGGRRGFSNSVLALLPGLWRRETWRAPRVSRRGAVRPAGPRGGGSPLPRSAEPPLSLPPAAPRAGRLLGAHHHVHQLVAHVRRHRRRRRGPPGAAAAAAAAGGGGAQPPAGTRPAPPGAPRRGRPPGGLHQRPGAQGEPPAAGPPLSPGPRGSRGPRAAPSSQGGTDPVPAELSLSCPPCGGGYAPGGMGWPGASMSGLASLP